MRGLVIGILALAVCAGVTTNVNAARLPYPPADYEPTNHSWSLFLSGEYTLQCHRTGSFVKVLGECAGGDCMCEPNFGQTRSLMDLLQESDWQKLAYTIIYQQEQKTGLQPADFFYVMLGSSAFNMGHNEAALSYYNKARSARYSCLRYGRPDDGRSCGSAARFKRDWLEGTRREIETLIEADRREAARQKEAAHQVELQRQRAEQAQQAKNDRITRLQERFPDEWVNRIVEGEIQVGFTKDAVREAIGEPNSVLVTPGGREMWVYSDKKVIFDGSVVTHIDD